MSREKRDRKEKHRGGKRDKNTEKWENMTNHRHKAKKTQRYMQQSTQDVCNQKHDKTPAATIKKETK